MKIIAILFLLILCSNNCLARHELCERHIDMAENLHNLPNKLLKAIAKVESGRFDQEKRSVRPWPWTVQCEGKSHYFDSKQQAVSFVQTKLKSGTKPGSIDVGCMQINIGAHGHHFAGIDSMFDPAKNINYGATHLKNHKKQSGSWLEAAGNYHSVTPIHHNKYRGLVSKAWNKIDPYNNGNINTHEFFNKAPQKPRVIHIKQTKSLPGIPANNQFKSMYGGRNLTYNNRVPQMRRIKTTEMRWFSLRK